MLSPSASEPFQRTSNGPETLPVGPLMVTLGALTLRTMRTISAPVVLLTITTEVRPVGLAALKAKYSRSPTLQGVTLYVARVLFAASRRTMVMLPGTRPE